MRKYLIITVVGLLLLGCSEDDDLKQPDFVGKTFDHLYFDTEKECLDAQPEPDFFINCHQQLDFLDDEKAEIMLSDIIYSTTYSVENNEITVYSTEHTYEFRNDLIFEIIDPATLRLKENNTFWKERIGDSPWK